MKKTVEIDNDLCIGCVEGVKVCPRKILYIDKDTNKCMVTDESRCDKLRGCEKKCPTKAIKIN